MTLEDAKEIVLSRFPKDKEASQAVFMLLDEITKLEKENKNLSRDLEFWQTQHSRNLR